MATEQTLANQRTLAFELGRQMASNSLQRETVQHVGSTLVEIGCDLGETRGYLAYEVMHGDQAQPGGSYGQFFYESLSVVTGGILRRKVAADESNALMPVGTSEVINSVLLGAEFNGAEQRGMRRTVRGVLSHAMGQLAGKGGYSAVDDMVYLQQVMQVGKFGNVWTELAELRRSLGAVRKYGADIYDPARAR